MCGIDFDKRTKTVLTEDLIEKITNELKIWTNHIKKINLYSDNEPLLDRNLAKRIKKLKNIGIKVVTIASNASILTQKRAIELVESGLDEIYITIDSMNPELYERIRVGLNFHRVYQNTLNLIRCRDESCSNMSIRLQMILQENNQDEKNGFVKQWEKLLSPGDQIVIQKAHNWGGSIDTPFFHGDDVVNTFPCPVLWANAMIHADGNVALCSADTEPDSPHTLGNIANNTIEETWNSKDLYEIRERHLTDQRKNHPLCNGCTTWRPNKFEIFVNL